MKKIERYGLPISILFFIISITVFGPLELYITNSTDLWFNFRDTILVSCIMSAAALLITGGIALILPKKWRSAYAAILFTFTFCLYLQGNYINISYGVLDGNAVDWSAYTKYAVLDSAIWIVLICGLLLLWKKKESLFRILQIYGSLLIIAMQLLTLGYLIVTTNAFSTQSTQHYLSTEGMYEISAQDNVIIFVLDAFDQSFLEQILEETPEQYSELLADFTQFNNAATGGHSTWAGMPAMITGDSYKGGVVYADYVQQAFDSDGLYSALKENNYHTALFTDSSYVPKDDHGLIDNMVSSGFTVSSYTGLAKTYSSFTLYKYMPHVLKQFFWLYTGDFDQYRDGGSAEHYDFNDVNFYQKLSEQKLTIGDAENVLRLYHLEGPHPPFDMNEYAQETEASSIMVQARGCLHIVEEYINQMKQLGVYDDSMIIITADHGQTTPGHPILLVKERGTEQEYSVSSAPVSHFDMHNTIFSYLGEDRGDTFFDIPENTERKRYYNLFNSEGSMITMTEYVIDGDLHDPDSVSPTGIEYAPDEAQSGKYTYGTHLSFGTDGTVTQFTESGISFASTGFAWTDGYECSFRFPLETAPKEDLMVYVYTVAVMTDTGPQEIRVYANDHLVYETTRSDSTALEFTVPKDLIGESNVLNLRFELPNAVCLYELYGAGNDPRLLGLAMTDLIIIDPGYSNGIMDKVTRIIGIPLTWLLEKCNNVVNNYVLAIFVFTFLTKVILLPVSLWTNKNGIIMIKMMPELNRLKVKYYGDKETISDETQALYKREKYNPIASSVPMIIQVILLMGVIDAVKQMLGGAESILNAVPVEAGSITWAMPVLAALAALALGIGQNLLNPLQKEQTKKDQWITNGISIAISLFLGAFVSVGTCVYWIASNLFTIPFQWLMNKMMPPEKYVDYEALEESRKQLQAFEGVGGKKKESYFSENKKREREDYKRFFSVVNKHLVFYSESNGFYKYYKGFIEYLLKYTNLPIHYITSDPNDQIFEMAKSEPRIRGYYIGENKLITLMMKMDADVVVMTMPDLENYHIKRSYVRDDIEYINIPHGMGSNNLTLRTGALDHFDTIFCAGVHQKTENLQTEAAYNLPAKTCVEVGYPLLDEMRAKYNSTAHAANVRKKILIAPSWQVENIIDSCLEPLLDSLKTTGYEIIVRPHPQEVRLKEEYMKTLKEKYEPQGIEIQTDFTSNNPVLEADILITDWSDISWEYAFTTLRPVMYINTPMKVMNPEWQKIEEIPLNILLRDKLGKSLNTDELHRAAETVEYLLAHSDAYREEIDKLAHEYIYNLDSSSRVGAKYIISAVQKKIAERGKNK